MALLLSSTFSIPAPQSDYDEFYGDYDESVAEVGENSGGNIGDILRSGAGLAGSLFSLFNSKVKFINMLLTDKVMVCRTYFFCTYLSFTFSVDTYNIG